MKILAILAVAVSGIALVASMREPNKPSEPAPDHTARPPMDERLASVAAELATSPATHLIAPGAEQVIPLDLTRDEDCIVALAGERTSDLDAWIVSEAGRSLASDTDSTDVCLLIFNVDQDSPLALHVHNVGSEFNAYRVVHR